MQPNYFFAVERVIDRQPLTVAPKTPLVEVIGLMQKWGNSCNFDRTGNWADDNLRRDCSCVVIVENNRLVGIFTERDLVKLIATEVKITEIIVAKVMTRDVVTLKVSEGQDIFTALNLFRQHRIQHLPVVDDRHNLIGTITAKNLRQKLQPLNLMQWRKVAEIMSTEVRHAKPDDTVRQIARLMSDRQISCVAIAKTRLQPDNSSLVCPIGIITERDLVQFQNLNLNPEQPARNIMSAPLFLVSPEDNLWRVHQQMQQHRVRRLLVSGTKGELLGIVTQNSLLEIFDPAQMYEVIDILQKQVCQLEIEKERFLENRQAELEREIKERITAIETSNRRLQQEAQLRRENERRFDSILNSLQDLVWAVTPNTFQVLYVNPTVKTIYDRPAEAFYANTNLRWEVVHLDDRERVLGFYQSLLAEGNQQVEYRILRPDGSIRWLLDRFQVIYYPDGTPMRLDGITTDISRRKQTEILLRESQERYHLAVVGSRDGLWDWNVLTDEVFYAPRFLEMLGYSDAEMPNHFEAWSSKLHPDDRERVLSAIQNHLEERIPYDIEYRLQTKQGDYCWFKARGQAIWDEDSRAIRMAGSLTDISERKKRENIIKDIASGMSVKMGTNFFPSVTSYLCQTLQLDYAFVAEISDSENEKVKTLAMCARGEIIDNIEYSLVGTPCQNVFKGEFCIYSEAVQHLFPEDLLLQEIAVESYAGFPIYDTAGKAYGLIAVLDSKPFDDVALIEEVMTIFAQRVTAELERQQAEQSLRASEARYRELYEHTPVMMHSIDSQGRLISVSDYWLRKLGYERKAVLGRKTIEFMTPASQKYAVEQVLPQFFERGFCDDIPYQMVKQNGEIIEVLLSAIADKDAAGNLIRSLAVSVDVTERKQAETRIEQQAALLDIANDAIMVLGLDRQILFWNRGAEQLYGWTKAEVLNRNASDFFHEESATQLTTIRQTVRERGEWQGEIERVTKTGQKIIVQSRWTLVRDANARPQSYLVVTTDITERKQLEAQFLRTQRLESLGTLAGGIAHDLNNILTPILGFAKLLPLKLPDVDEQTREFFQIMATNAQRGSALVKQILTFARGLEGDRGTLQICHLITEIKQVIKETFPKNIELKTSTVENLWTIEGDTTQIHQILMNLAVNARDAMPDGGTLTIEAENIKIDYEYARLHLDATEGAYVLLRVSDTGMGIPPEIKDRIFEPFFTTKEVGRGSGLGLSTVIGIVKSHNGFIELISDRTNRNRGTQFQVFLPASETTAATTTINETSPQGKGELILVVDDETAILAVTKATLEAYNYQMLSANNGIDAIALYARHQQKISLAIVDLLMPNLDGKTVIQTLKKINPEIKIIATSGLISQQAVLTEIEDKITAFINKPYSNEDLLRTIERSI